MSTARPTAHERFGPGSTALVTGAGAGLGEGMARHLAAGGAHVVVTDVDEARAADVAEACRTAGGSAEAHPLDVRDAGAVAGLFAGVWARHGAVDLVVSNAGIEAGDRVQDLAPERWAQVLEINLNGAFHCAHAAIPLMSEQGRPGALGIVSSTGGVSTLPYQAAYIASKHAALALAECLHVELQATGAPVQVSALMPNWVRSRIFDDVRAGHEPTDPAARAFFAQMAEDNKARGLDPATAARLLLDGLAAGDFWVFTDPERTAQLFRDRADKLLELRTPAVAAAPTAPVALA